MSKLEELSTKYSSLNKNMKIVVGFAVFAAVAIGFSLMFG